jgi:hypothetical protein
MNIQTVILTTFDTGGQSYTIKYDSGLQYSFVHNEENEIREASAYSDINSWVSEGNEIVNQTFPEPEPEPQELTVQEKLQAAGLTIEELKEALGL